MSFFKNILIYRFEEPFDLTAEAFNDQLAEKPLISCLSQEMESLGWLPAFNHGKNYVEKINNAYFFRLGIEQKILPNAAIKTAIEKKAEALDVKIESKSQYKELEEQVLNEIIPTALTQRSSIQGYIDLKNNWLIVDASSVKKASIVTSYLRKTLGSLAIINYAPETSMQAIMTSWVTNGIASSDIELLYDIELREAKDEGGVARIKGVPLDAKEITQHLESNWQVALLGLSYKEQLSFSLGNDFIFKRLRFLDAFQEQIEADDEPLLQMHAQAFVLVDSFRAMISHVYELCHS